MNFTRRVLPLCLVALCFSFPSAGDDTRFHDSVQALIRHDASPIVIENVRIVDGTGVPAQRRQSVLIRDGRIEAIGRRIQHPDDTAVVIDGKGRTLLPGYVMLHEHLLYLNPYAFPWGYTSEHLVMPPLYLAAGATTIRTGGSFDAEADLRTKDLIERGLLAGPNLFITAPFMGGAGKLVYQLRPMLDPDQIRQFVRYWVSAGATSFKAYMTIPPAVLEAAIDEAHQLGVQVTGHLCSVTFAEAAEMGIDNLEHGLSVATDIAPDKASGECPHTAPAEQLKQMDMDDPQVQALIATLVAEDVTITSTLPVFAAGIHSAIPTEQSLGLLSDRSREVAEARWQRMRESSYAERRVLEQALLKREMAFERTFVNAGGNLVVGTDPTGWGGTLPPNSTHAALELLVEAGFTPLEVINLATLNGARFLGVDDEVGSIAVGKRANLILVDGKPDRRIQDVQNVELVFKDGIAYDPAALIDSVRGSVGR